MKSQNPWIRVLLVLVFYTVGQELSAAPINWVGPSKFVGSGPEAMGGGILSFANADGSPGAPQPVDAPDGFSVTNLKLTYVSSSDDIGLGADVHWAVTRQFDDKFTNYQNQSDFAGTAKLVTSPSAGAKTAEILGARENTTHLFADGPALALDATNTTIGVGGIVAVSGSMTSDVFSSGGNRFLLQEFRLQFSPGQVAQVFEFTFADGGSVISRTQKVYEPSTLVTAAICLLAPVLCRRRA